MGDGTGAVVVVGATGYVGGSVAAYLHGQGREVVAIGRDETKLGALRDRLGGERLRTVALDLTDDAAAHRAAAALAGRVDAAVVAVGGWYVGDDAVDLDFDTWQRTLQTNLVAHVVAARAFAPRLDGPDPAYVALNGVASHSPTPGSAPVNLAGAAQRMLVEVLAAEAIGRTVRFHEVVVEGNVVEPDDLADRGPADGPAVSVGTVCAAVAHVLATPAMRDFRRLPVLPEAG